MAVFQLCLEKIQSGWTNKSAKAKFKKMKTVWRPLILGT